MSALKIAIAGVNGRMGRVLVEAVNNHPDTVLSGALEHSGSEVLGLDAGFASGIKTGIAISDDVDAVLAQSDVLIDFTRPEPTLKHLQKCVEKGVNIIIGTTGFDDAGKAAIQAAGEKIGVVFAANFSVGVNLTFHILDTVARVLNEGYDIEIIEGHHRRLWPRRPYRPARSVHHRLCHRPRRRHRRRPYRPLRHRRRTRRNHPQSQQPHDLCRRRRPRRSLGKRQNGFVRYAGRTGFAQLNAPCRHFQNPLNEAV